MADESPVCVPELDWLWERARWRLDRGWPLRGPVTFTGASSAQRRAVARLLDRPLPDGEHLTVDLADVDAALRRAGVAGGLAAIASAHAASPDTAGTEHPDRAAWATLLDELRGWSVRRPETAMWAEELAGTGLLEQTSGGDPQRARVLLASAIAVLERLPAPGLPLADLAAAATDDPAALADPSLERLVLPGAALLAGVPPGSGRRWVREVWAANGVVPADAGEPVLVHGLPTATGVASGRLGLDELVSRPARWRVRGVLVSVCQDPAVVAALAAPAGPVVCLQGQPSAAATTLLRLLRRAGARLRVHVDFDWAGITAANAVIRRVGAAPWRLDAATYLAAAAGCTEPLRGAPVAASWDETLSQVMAAQGVRVPEEHLLDALLDDLLDR